MNFLFITDNTYHENNASLNIGVKLAACLMSKGHRVDILGNTEEKNVPLSDTLNGIEVARFSYPINGLTRRILREYRKNGQKTKLLKSLLRHPVVAAVGLLRALFGFNPIVHKYTCNIKALCNKRAYDAVVAFSAPFYTAMALAKVKIKARKILYMLDPYAQHYEMGGKRAVRQEAYVLKRIDNSIVTKEIYADYQGTVLSNYYDKMLVREFPCVEVDSGGSLPGFDGDTQEKYELLFAGNFYATLRPPTYLLKLLDLCDRRLHLTVLGNMEDSMSETDKTLANRLIRADKLAIHGVVDAGDAKMAMRKADILVNIGNSIENMLPSKIYDYISTGKPIINICRIHNCPSLSRLADYPMAFNLFEGDPLNEAVCGQVTDFIASNAGKTLKQDWILRHYQNATPEYVCETLLHLTAARIE